MDSSQLTGDIAAAFIEVAKQIVEKDLSVIDIYVRVKCDIQQMAIYDDSENRLLQVPLDEWTELKETPVDELPEVIITKLRKALSLPEVQQALEKIDVVAPLSVILVDDEHDFVEDLITIDKDNLLIGGDLFASLEKDLDAFYEELMRDANNKR